MEPAHALKKRVVIDTSSVIGAAIRQKSKPGLALDFALAYCTIYQSAQTLEELLEVLRRPKLDRYAALTDRLKMFANIAQSCERVEPPIRVTDCRDPKDNQFLELALHVRADALITSDDDLLALHPWRRIPILTPADFLIAVA